MMVLCGLPPWHGAWVSSENTRVPWQPCCPTPAVQGCAARHFEEAVRRCASSRVGLLHVSRAELLLVRVHGGMPGTPCALLATPRIPLPEEEAVDR